jgi:hypothetical protein
MFLDHERQRGCLGLGSLGWVDDITTRVGGVRLLPCFLQLLNADTVGVGDDVDPVSSLALDAVQGIVSHLAQMFGTQWVFG